MSETKSFYLTKSPLLTSKENCKSTSMSDTVFGLLTCWLKYHVILSCGGIDQFNYDNRSQQHAEDIYGSYYFTVLQVPPEKHPTENGVVA